MRLYIRSIYCNIAMLLSFGRRSTFKSLFFLCKCFLRIAEKITFIYIFPAMLDSRNRETRRRSLYIKSVRDFDF